MTTPAPRAQPEVVETAGLLPLVLEHVDPVVVGEGCLRRDRPRTERGVRLFGFNLAALP